MSMMNEKLPSQNVDPEALAALPARAAPEGQSGQAQELTPEQKRMIIGLIIGLIVIIILIVAGVIGLALSPPQVAAKVRDISIILMAILSLMIGASLVILLVQLARLTNLLQNEIRPILDSMNETVSHLRGTTVFLSDNLVEPVIRLNEYLAGISQLLSSAGFRRKSSRSKTKTTKGE